MLHFASEVPNNKEIVGLLIMNGAIDAHIRPKDDLARQLLAAVFLADESRTQALLQLTNGWRFNRVGVVISLFITPHGMATQISFAY